MEGKQGNLGGVILILFFFGVFGYALIDIGVFEPARKEAVSIQLIRDGISVQEVTINSPNVYFEIDDYDEFKEIMREQGSNTVYHYSGSYYIFNADYTLAWRISYTDIYGEIE